MYGGGSLEAVYHKFKQIYCAVDPDLFQDKQHNHLFTFYNLLSEEGLDTPIYVNRPTSVKVKSSPVDHTLA